MQTKFVATIALLIMAVFSVGIVSADQKIANCAGPADYGYDAALEAGAAPITYEAPVFGVGVEKFNVGEEEKLAIEKLNIVNTDIQDSFLNVPRQHIPVGTSYETDTIAAMHELFAPYII